MVITLKDRARGVLTGLAVGDALGAPTEGHSPEAIRKKWGRITGFLDAGQHGSDDTEYALFSAQLLLRYAESLTPELVAEGWRRDIINPANAYKGAGFSEIIAIRNLSAGVNPPYSGQHLHSWSDGLAMRAAPYGIVFCGEPDLAADYVRIDGEVSHSGEGIYGGQAVAAAVATAVSGGNMDEVFNSAMKVVPAESWTRSALSRGIKIGSECETVWDALEPLYGNIAVPYYYWPDVAPEAVGIAFGLVAASKGKFDDAVLGAVNIGRDTDTIAAIAGAIIGALHGIDCIPEEWRNRITAAKGICIASVKDMEILPVADALAALYESRAQKRRMK
ncbi:MAG: ADP-ribosylglycohydrolase family protein [Ignavibacteriaceae bacterium]|nr:ADP-ribosylglycohydrolase family protein [Ignavibacteriaceae bacterium]